MKMNLSPFPHLVVDDYLDPSLLLRTHAEMERYAFWGWDNTQYSSHHQINKKFTPWCEENLQDLRRECPSAYEVLQHLNSPSHLSKLETLSGIPQLLPDPSFVGGGIHKISTGGKLDIHADYNVHPITGLHRRLNLLLYFTPNWQPEWGGELELWERDMSKMSVSIPPLFNRAAMFLITDDAFHGHPYPLKTPPHIHRYSFALYYFTKERPDHEISPPHSALWKPLQQSKIFEV
jgi:hypothetical protein